MKIHTSYVILIQRQLTAAVVKKTGQLQVTASRMVDDRLMRQTADVCLQALTFCVSVFQKEWDGLSRLSGQLRKNAAEKLIHSTRDNTARYPEFDRKFKNFPSYIRRAVTAKALGMVSSYVSNYKNWLALSPAERGGEPVLGLPDRYELTFYDQERKLSSLKKGQVGLKLYDGKSWG